MEAVTGVRGDKRRKSAEVKGIMGKPETENSIFSKRRTKELK